MIEEVLVLRWVHIIAMVYWLGGEWGVFQSSYNIINRNLSLEERKRHMETAYRIDILARTGIIMLLPLGLHMGNIYGLQPYGDGYLTAMWVFVAGWLGLCWGAFFTRETDLGIRLTKLDEAIRYVLIPTIFVLGISSLLGNGPFEASEGSRWYATKFTLYGFTLCIGLGLRWIMRLWTMRFRALAAGPDPVQEAALEREIVIGRCLAYVYWITISGICFLGTVKPF
ncbi:hypothetical protein [Novosphingobium taihuense]|uniref:Copper resistance protein D n=1 Tax=Novosphingobium taihuense TaxID=260085 RepID=A0A7W7EV91_9SPHN|nr:hypothetical protein [Novosphingobium taihuense]MBB4614791.1 hypothetical protein [Novosphingobium taihuense]TWH84767.1 hypothetical protein IQ25_02522 [Novosphingobium taihuense]